MNSFFFFGAFVWTDLAVFKILYYDFVLIIYISGVWKERKIIRNIEIYIAQRGNTSLFWSKLFLYLHKCSPILT